MSTAALLWALVFSSVGLGFFVYGKKQSAIVPLACGLILIVFPYFIPNTILLVAFGFSLIAVPYFFRI